MLLCQLHQIAKHTGREGVCSEAAPCVGTTVARHELPGDLDLAVHLNAHHPTFLASVCGQSVIRFGIAHVQRKIMLVTQSDL